MGKPAKANSPKPETTERKRARAIAILKKLKSLYSDAECALTHDSPLQLLVATILSAQCTDERVNKVTPALFARYKTAKDFATARPAELEKLIQSTGFFRNKAKNIIGAGRVITEKHGGIVPDTMEDLLTLPGVARKTANVVLGSAFGKNEGVVVDTHIGRLSHRLGLTWRSKNDKDAVKIERDLMEIIPRDEWTYFGHALILHGRRICSARKPDCEKCTLSDLCPSAFIAKENGSTFKKAAAKNTKTGKASNKRSRR
ncbi:MAG: endonuclease III [Planctomycetes bacterium]|nr:endonuclease III [Planctomycetota bacterium]